MNTTNTDKSTATATPVIHSSQHMRVVTNAPAGFARELISCVTVLELRWVGDELRVFFTMRETRIPAGGGARRSASLRGVRGSARNIGDSR
ncbi:hypothetical protein SOM08_06090 [Hydrogenophaga sp. SNF1]|uniref:hypothetical protein n=1 Tax=Hydrogenophaga sp. SNF1 TaxID=3098762 RepID=UPI002ACBFBF4|nr:hypothetical protein [Hydrogenophaga sp. SNF1]WQB84881.1 hypothetical protein SOM08_06090 [Hydrogenophaga sp. SNF1]